MNKIDLIIDALEMAENKIENAYVAIHIDEALAAARELRQELAKPDEKPEWQELYKDEVYAIINDGEEWTAIEFAQAVSDLLKEKNT